MKHNTCGYEWKVKPSNFINNETQCPRCARKGKSRGEALIEDYLIEHNIDYEPQKTFDDCVGNAEPLPFDFYIPSANMAIEYDGEQHFRSMIISVATKSLPSVSITIRLKTNTVMIMTSFW